MMDELEYARRILGLTCCRYSYAEFADRYVADAELADFGVNAECLETSAAAILREYREAVLREHNKQPIAESSAQHTGAVYSQPAEHIKI